MSHPHDALLQAHLDGELEPTEMREVTRHLTVCDACRRASAELASVSYSFSEMIGRLDDAEPEAWRAAALLPASPAAHFDSPATMERSDSPPSAPVAVPEPPPAPVEIAPAESNDSSAAGKVEQIRLFE